MILTGGSRLTKSPQPSVILVSLVALFLSPGNFFTSLAPDTSSGLLFQRDLSLNTCAAVESWNTPQLRVLLYQFSGALAFSAIIEPSLLYVAQFKLSDPKDAERVVQAVLMSFLAFDVLHALATAAVVGSSAIFPNNGWSGIHFYACINVWVPVLWMGARACWFAGFGKRQGQLKQD
jgi:hypothetical protein